MCCSECWEEVCCRECQAIPLWVGPLQLVDGPGFHQLALIVKPVRTPVAIFGSLGVCIYVPASRHWLISHSPIHPT